MFLLLNGAFGVGKTTTARVLVRQIAGARIYDPERVGFVLHRVPPWLVGSARRAADYQDIAAWRRSIVFGARWTHRRADLVVIPMAFSNLGYLDELDRALTATAPVRRLCLVAPIDAVRARLLERAQAASQALNQWAVRRATECCLAHTSAEFGTPIDAARTVEDVVADVRRAIGL